ncbi:hypothetical protein Q7P37_006822 [Cladosporium fusiforme]
MPGRLMMEDQNNAPGSEGFNKDRSHVSDTGAPQNAAPGSLPQTNGPVVNGVIRNGSSQENGRNGLISADGSSEPPPPLDQSWREGDQNKSLGKLMIRTAERCFVDLNELLAHMAQQKVSQQGAQANGVTEQDMDAVSLAKKRQLLEFAQTQRERFIKALVINDWSKDADAFAGIIDVNAHLGLANACHTQATAAVGEMKLAMNHAKMPNPNIEGALQLLASGKSSLTDLGYVTPPKMSAKELLQTLRNMNVMLATRLTLHEELPDHLNEYTIADGRATFTVPGEFAVDLAVADEDPASPFFFIELRFLFTPAPTQISEQIQNYCEMEVNKAIAAKGLWGCYDILHNLVLTHKLNILHSQTTDLVRGKWFECIRVERIRRIFVVSYWTGIHGRKSWIEFGIASGKTKGGPAKQKATPVIATRWFQRGMEVQSEKLDIDWHCIDLEAILLQAIAKHTSSDLRHVKEDLERLVVGKPAFSAELTSSTNEPNDCALTLKLPSLRTPIRCFIEPVTGQIAISPITPATRSTQNRLNNDTTAEKPKRLASMMCAVALEHVDTLAATVRWQPVMDLGRQDNLRAFFGEDLWQRKVFVPSEKWGTEWAIAITIGLAGSQWWIVNLKAPDNTRPRVIVNARKLRTHATNDAVVSRSLLLQIEKAALAEVSYTTLAMQLDHLHIPHHFERPSLIATKPRPGHQFCPAMFINFSKLMNVSRDKNWKPWAQELVRFTHHGEETRPTVDKSERPLVRHDLRLALHNNHFKELRKHLKNNSRRHEFAINETGGLAVRFCTPFGVPFVENIRAKLSAIKRLDHYLAVLKSCHLKCDTATLSRLAFTYGSNPALSAHLVFSNDERQPIKLRLEPPDSNPHVLMRTMLEQSLNGIGDNAFSDTVHILQLSLPVLRTVEKLQSSHPSRHSLLLHMRSVSWYSLKFKAPLPQLTFQLRTRTRVEGTQRLVRWHLEQERPKAGSDSMSEDLPKALNELWHSETEQYLGLGSGLVADAHGIGPALEKVDEILRRFENDSLPAQAAQPKAAEQTQEVIALD